MGSLFFKVLNIFQRLKHFGVLAYKKYSNIPIKIQKRLFH